MIKWLLLSVLTANIVVFVWFGGRQEIVPRKVDQVSWQAEFEGEIVLLSELEIISAIHSIASTETPRADELRSDESEARASGEPSLLSGKVGWKAIAGAGDAGIVGGREYSERDALHKVGLDNDIYLENVPQTETNPELEPESSRIAQVGIGLHCVALGRFDKEQAANALLEKLQQAVGVIAKVKAVPEGVVRYLVYMPPYETRVMAKAQQAILKEDGVRSSLYYKGDLQNGLSLGYFGSRGNAERRYEALLAAGYGVALKTIESQVTRYWIELQRGGGEKLSRNFWRDMAEEFPNVKGQEVACSSAQQDGRTE